MIKIAIITGSTRPVRLNRQIADWVLEQARLRTDAHFELVDIVDYDLPLLNEPLSPYFAQYEHDHTKKWSATIAAFDAYVFVTPEYNHATSASLKNAIDYLAREWNNKSAGFVSYGAAGGVRAVENLRLILGELQVADVKHQVALSLYTDFEQYKTFKPTPAHEQSLTIMLDQVIAWGQALRPLRHQD